jgi:hypothetical protein
VCGFTRPLESELGKLGYLEIEKTEPISVAGNDWSMDHCFFWTNGAPLFDCIGEYGNL